MFIVLWTTSECDGLFSFLLTINCGLCSFSPLGLSLASYVLECRVDRSVLSLHSDLETDLAPGLTAEVCFRKA